MSSGAWTLRFENYHPIDESMEERLQRICGEIDKLPASAVRVDQENRLVVIDYSQVRDRFEASRQVLRTVRAGKRVVVKPPWEEFEAASADIVIEIDPGEAFGSGLHETTRLCLQSLEEYIRPGMSVVDFGSGSGILAIASAKLGASSVVAIEADSISVEAARANVERNGLDGIVEVWEACSLESTDRQQVDLVVANIVAEVIVPEMPELSRILKAGGTLICSGLTIKNAPDVERAMPPSGLELIEKLTQGHWVALVAVRQ